MNNAKKPGIVNAKTFYERPWLDRITGHYTVEWESSDGVKKRRRVHNRLQDMEGNFPSILSVLCLPEIVRTYLLIKRCPILKYPKPFLVVDAIRFLDKIVKPGMRILELGGGNSSLWFCRRGVTLTTIEHSEEWINYIRGKNNNEISGKWEIYCMMGSDVINYIERQEDAYYDLVLVDCANEYTSRYECVSAVKKKIVKGGWLVLDNSDHPNNLEAKELMRDARAISFSGYSPMCLTVSQTTFWQM